MHADPDAFEHAVASELVTFPPERIAYRILKSGYRILLGKPRMQILMPSSTPLQVSWCMMRGGLHLAGLLVGVGHKATHEVGLARVEGGHQLNQGDKVDGRHSLAASLLLLLALLLGGGSGLARVVFPEKDQKLTGGGGLHDLDDSVVDGVLVLLKPSSDVVPPSLGVVVGW